MEHLENCCFNFQIFHDKDIKFSILISLYFRNDKGGVVVAIYHCSVQVIGRSSGKSSVASAAYRAAEKMYDDRTGLAYDYTRKTGVDFKEILTPEGSPDWMKNRDELWNRVEAVEKRKDAQVAREINIALPIELNKEQQIELLKEYVEDNFVKLGMIADVAIHNSKGSNPHAHIMLTTREISSEGFGNKNREWNDKELLEGWRASWSEHANHALASAGNEERIDHRSLEAQMIDRVPQIHVGVHAWAMEKKGIETDRGSINREIKEINRQIEELKKEKVIALKEYAGLKDLKVSALEKQEDMKEQAEKEVEKIIEMRKKYFEHARELVKIKKESSNVWQLKNDMTHAIESVCGYDCQIDEYTRDKERDIKELKNLGIFSFGRKKELERKIESSNRKIQGVWDNLESYYRIKEFGNNINKLKESMENYIKDCEAKNERLKVEIYKLNENMAFVEKEYKYLSVKSKLHDGEYKDMVAEKFTEIKEKNKVFELKERGSIAEKSMFAMGRRILDSLSNMDVQDIKERLLEKDKAKLDSKIESREIIIREMEIKKYKGWGR